MVELIDTLKEEHKRIIYLFEDLKESTSKESKKEYFTDSFEELKEVLVAHLDLEDKLLYPKFQKAEQEEIKELGASFSKQMNGITVIVLKFFEDYSKESSAELANDKEFAEKLDGLISSVKSRVEIEEKILFPAYEINFK